MVSLPGRRGRKTVPARNEGELDAMAAAGAVVAAALRAVQQAAVAGMSTKDLDEVAETVIREAAPPLLPRLPRLPGEHLLLGQRPGGAQVPVPMRCWCTATWCPSTAVRSSRVARRCRRLPAWVS